MEAWMRLSKSERAVRRLGAFGAQQWRRQACAGGALLLLLAVAAVRSLQGCFWSSGPACGIDPDVEARRLRQRAQLDRDALLRQWQEFARERRCSLDDGSYQQIHDDLAPFCTAGISLQSVFEAHARLNATLLLTVRAGRLGMHGHAPLPGAEHPDFSERLWGLRTLGDQARFWRDLMRDFAHRLPDMAVLLNLLDQPRSWVAPVPPQAEAVMQQAGDSSGAVAEAWRQHACDSVGMADAKQGHGFLASASQFYAERGLLPILSAFKVQGCFGDILVPVAWNNEPSINAVVHRARCPISCTPWAKKRSVAFWRGTTTGAFVSEATPQDEWEQYHRQRLVSLSQQHPEEVDAGFTGYLHCDRTACAAMEKRYGRAAAAPTDQMFEAKYQVVIDGNGAATRFGPTLCSGALSMAVDPPVFREWFWSRLRAGQHFLPIHANYSNLEDQVRWARGHDAEARRIAAAAAEFANARLRREEQQCYMYRLLLEYALLLK